MEIRKRVTRVFVDNREALCNSPKRYICNEGGSRSGKTYSIIQLLIMIALDRKARITVCSHSLPHLKRGALRDFDTIIRDFGLYREEWHNRTDNVYHFPNGSYIEFFGLEDADKARGAGRDILFVNEANLVGKPVFDQLDMRTFEKVIIDLNPSDFDSWCYSLADGDNAVKITSTYKDNIENLPKPLVDVIEGYKDADPVMWQVFGLGLRGTSQDQVYTHWRIAPMPEGGDTFYGLDFGFNNPTALVRCKYYDNELYVDEVLYMTKLTTGDLIERLRALDIREQIFCDNAEPKTIEALYRDGFNALPSDKAVTEGIRTIKSRPLFVTSTSSNIIRELKNYKWKVDKDGKTLDEPEKANDHAMDAIRYAGHTKQKAPSITWGAL